MGALELAGGMLQVLKWNRSRCITSSRPYRHIDYVSWLSRGPDSSGEVWIGCKRLILKLSKVLLTIGVEGPYRYANRRLILI
jgi:hypothetical protein